MRSLPLADPGQPDLRSPARFLLRVARLQRREVALGVLAALLTGRTVVAIAHRLHTASDADRVAVVEHGRVSELGTHGELLALGGSYAALWASWQAS